MLLTQRPMRSWPSSRVASAPLILLAVAAFAACGDVSKPDEFGGLFDRVAAEWGGLDIYINNAIDVASFGPVTRLRADARH